MMTLAKKYLVSLETLVEGFSTDTLNSTVSVSGLTIDSRLIKQGDCFVALKGAQADGAHYIEQSSPRRVHLRTKSICCQALLWCQSYPYL